MLSSSNAARILLASLAVLLWSAALGPLHAQEAVWQRLREGGHAILIRHALAPGAGDPPGFVLGDCSTQRNLSEEGRAQARRIGAAIRNAGVKVDRVLSSRWCRASETAALLGLGPAEPFAPLDSFFADSTQGAQRTAETRALLKTLGARTVVLVTHQVNITALTGIYPASGEMIVVKIPRGASGRLEVVGRVDVGGGE